MVDVDGLKLKILWYSVASITVMSRCVWERLGKPSLSERRVILKLKHELLSWILFKGVLVYFDEILVYGKTLAQHNEILKTIRSHKCYFGRKSIN